jgi:small-conductance mechanosensitive channel
LPTINELKKELAKKSDKIQKHLNRFSLAEDLDLLLQYSKANFTLIKESTEYVEKKADDLIKYLVAAVGFLVAFLGFLIKSFPSHHLSSVGWAVMGVDTALWFAAIILALLARSPSAYLTPSTLEGLLSTLETQAGENNSTALRNEIILNYELAAGVHSTRGKEKAGKLKCAYYLSVIALFLFVVGVVLFNLSSSAAH